MSKISDNITVQTRLRDFLYDLSAHLFNIKILTQLIIEAQPNVSQEMAKWLQQLALMINQVKSKRKFF